MTNKEIAEKAKSVMHDIVKTMEGFTEIWQSFYRKLITESEMKSQIHNKLSGKSQEELTEYNDMCKMFSETNCGFHEFMAGRAVHEVIMEILYPGEEMLVKRTFG